MINDRRIKEHWHLDKRVPLALMLALIAQTGSVIWWASGIDYRIGRLEIDQSVVAVMNDKVIRLEEQLKSSNELLREIREELRKRGDA